MSLRFRWRFGFFAAVIGALLSSRALRAQSPAPADTFTVRGTAVTIQALRTADVQVRADSSGTTYAVIVRAVEVDGWTPRARLATSRGAATDTLRGRSMDGTQPASLVVRSAARAPATLDLRGADGSGMRVRLGAIFSMRFLQLLEQSATRAHELFAQGSTPATSPRTAGPPCAESMEQLHQSRGYPEHYARYNDGDYHSEEWSYENGARSYTFAWNNGEPGCKMSTFDSH